MSDPPRDPDPPPSWPPPGGGPPPPPPPGGPGPPPPPPYGEPPPYGAPPPPPYGTPAPGYVAGYGGGASGPSGPRAGFGTRFVAALIDGILLTIVNLPVRLLLGPAAGFGFGLLISFAYYGYFEGGPSGQTVGKKAVDIRVVLAADGGPLGWGTAMLRHLCSYLSGLACLIGYLWMLWDSEKQTWHDKLSATVVVPSAAWPPPPDSFGKAPLS